MTVARLSEDVTSPGDWMLGWHNAGTLRLGAVVTNVLPSPVPVAGEPEDTDMGRTA